VGVVGYATGGGFGWLGRRYGLAVNSIRAIEVVTSDARLHRVDAGNDPDLFWALRGGGGNFGVVTALEFDLIDLPEVYAGSVIYPADESSADIFRRYREWTRGVPDKVTSIARFLHLPPEPDIPEPLRGRPVITLGATYAGPAAEGAEIIEPLRRLGDPVMDTFRAMAPSGLVDVHMEPEQPVPVLAETASLAKAPEEAFDAFVRAAGPGSGSPLVVAELRHAGAALAVPPSGAGARTHLDGEFVFLGLGMPMAPGDADAINGHTDSIREALRPWLSERRYFNFADRTADPAVLYDAYTLNRLREVKRRYDPADLFAGVHALGQAS
jgi:FAD/FMN-containing dehydrogenase